MIQTDSKHRVVKLMLLFAAAYFTSYITRSNYAAVMAAMVTDTGHPKTVLSLALTGSFFTYGLGQVASGFFGDHISPRKLLGCGLGITAVCNLLLPMCAEPWQMIAVWSVNGFAQAFMWPPLVKLMTFLLPEKDYHRGVVWVSYGCNGATILLYLVAPVLIPWLGWKSLFYLASVLAVGMLVLWLRGCPEIGKVTRKTQGGEAVLPGGKKALFAPMMLAVMVAILLHGILKDGVATFMPIYIKETYHTGDELAILSGVLMPIFSILSTKASAVIYKKKFKNPVACAAWVFGLSAVCALLLAVIGGGSAVVSIVLMALLTGSMHGVNMMLISSIPPFFKKYGTVSTASGVLNACTYVGSAASTYGIAVLSENMGWSFTLWMWLAIAVFGGGLCLLAMRPFQKKML